MSVFERALAPLALSAALIVTPLAAHAQSIQSIGSSGHGGTFTVPLNKSEVLRVERPFAQALIGSAEIADILPLTSSSVYVLGKKPGTTSLTFYDRGKSPIAVIDIAVGPDVNSLKRELAELMPRETIGARVSNDSILLNGVLSSAVAVDRAKQIAETYAPGKVVNMMSVGASQQVMLEVRFSEMKRQAAKQIGINAALRSNSGKFIGSLGNNAASTLLLTDQAGKPTINIAGIMDAFGIVGGTASIGSVQIAGLLDALESKGVVTTLAEPNLIALSGETASFLAGGEFPIPVAQSARVGGDNDDGSAITIEFKPFGVSLAFTPTVLEDGIINLVVEPEVSSIDANSSISINGLTIPGLQTRRAKTVLELRDGQSFAIAGLLRKDFVDTVDQFPILGSIPVIGALFRSSGFQKDESELVIIVTPRLVQPSTPDRMSVPTDRATPPSELELFLMGRTDNGTPDVTLDESPSRSQSGGGAATVPPPSPTSPQQAKPTGFEGEMGHQF